MFNRGFHGFRGCFFRAHPWHPWSICMRRGIACGRCKSADFGRRVLRDASWIFERFGGANGDEPVGSVSVATRIHQINGATVREH